MAELSHKKWKLQSLQRFDFHMIAYFQTWLISWKVLLAQLVNENLRNWFCGNIKQYPSLYFSGNNIPVIVAR